MLFVSSKLSARFNCSLRFSSCTIVLGLLFTVSLEHLQCLRQAWLTRLSLDGLAHRNLGRSSEISLTHTHTHTYSLLIYTLTAPKNDQIHTRPSRLRAVNFLL